MPRRSRCLLPALALLCTVAAPVGALAAKPRNASLGDRLPLAKGAQGHDVKVLQDFLNRDGQPTAVDGAFGTTTKRAVLAFERAQRLAATGTVTAEVVKVLRDVAVQGSAVASISSVTGGATVPTEAQIQAIAPGEKATVGADGLAGRTPATTARARSPTPSTAAACSPSR